MKKKEILRFFLSSSFASSFSSLNSLSLTGEIFFFLCNSTVCGKLGYFMYNTCMQHDETT